MKAALYCRLSKEDENKKEESESIKNQKILLTSFAIEKDWDIYKIYVDDGDIIGLNQKTFSLEVLPIKSYFLPYYPNPITQTLLPKSNLPK